MKFSTILGLVLLITGLLVMIYGGFSYTSKSRVAHVGSIDLTVSEKKMVYIPIWIGIITFVSGGAVLFINKKKRT